METSVNPDLQKERDGASFKVDEMINFIDDGIAQTRRRKQTEKDALADKAFNNPLDFYHLSREEAYGDGVRRAAAYLKGTKGWRDKQQLNIYKGIAFPWDNSPLDLHEGMFLVTLENQLSDEQKKTWLTKSQNYEIIGTYAQTELGHGTHVRGLETTSTYDPQTQEFVINSPTLTSTKWWPGALGKSSNTVVVQAQTYTKGVNHGVMTFLVQIRDLKTHEPLPGVTVGDIGPKFGYGNMDNGFLRFDNVRIPRDQLLAKFVEVKEDGTLERKSSNSKLGYGTMVWVRAVITFGIAGYGLASASTVATRYSAVRRQSELQAGAREPQVLDYQTQQAKIFPSIALAYAYLFAGKNIILMYFQVTSQIQQGDTSMLPELHALSSGMKALSTYCANEGIEQCRLACGGHGYSMASGLPKIYQAASPGVTFEGENSVLYLQCARFLIKAYQQSSSSDSLGDSVAYLAERHNDRSGLTSDCSLEALLDALKFSAASRVRDAGMKLEKLQNQGMPHYEAWNNTAVQLTKAAEAHCQYQLLAIFAQKVEYADGSESPLVVDALTRLCKLAALHFMTKRAGDFLRGGYMTSSQVTMLADHQLELFAALRPDAVALVDAFDFTDQGLASVLGRYDGQVYENLFKWVQSSRLNKTEIHDSYYKYLQPYKQMASKL